MAAPMPVRPTQPTPTSDLEIVITDDGSRTLRFAGSNVSWHSESGALAESELVFLTNSLVRERLQAGLATGVLEIGLGTGLNFWITASVALKRGTALSYTGIEPNLISLPLLDLLEHRRLDACQPAFDRFSKLIFEHHGNRCVVDNVCFECLDRLESPELAGPFDAIYHDPFSPEVAPELWGSPLFARLKLLLKPHARLVTYCVKSTIQQELKRAGFRLQKTRGPIGGKREVLIAINEPN
jgi:tRNA U34 5-methylaminomethyl-2-thiouridine-forming methyltransferase MnmC